jgi:fluoride exporter
MSINIVLVFLGSGIGGVIRYMIGLYCSQEEGKFPIHTLIANSLACFIIGFILAAHILASDFRIKKVFLAIGICGGMSTFSTLSYELILASSNRDWSMFFGYSVLSFTLCLFMTWIGIYLAAKI